MDMKNDVKIPNSEKCGKSDRCQFGAFCAYNYDPRQSFLCFELRSNKFKLTAKHSKKNRWKMPPPPFFTEG